MQIAVVQAIAGRLDADQMIISHQSMALVYIILLCKLLLFLSPFADLQPETAFSTELDFLD